MKRGKKKNPPPTEAHLTHQQRHQDLVDNDEDFTLPFTTQGYATTHVV